VIGVGGNIGSGKTTVSQIFREFGAHCISADEIGWRVLPEIKEKLKENFGAQIFTKDTVDRKKLREVAFRSKENLRILNSLSHPILIKNLVTELKKIKSGMVVIDAALLFDWPEVYKMVDFPILVRAKKSLMRKRALQRGIDEKIFNQILTTQKSENEMAQMARYIIVNNGTLAVLRKKCQKIFEEMKNDC